MEKYDILEIEATNIIWGYHISDYVYKYENIRKYGENLERKRAEEEGEQPPLKIISKKPAAIFR